MRMGVCSKKMDGGANQLGACNILRGRPVESKCDELMKALGLASDYPADNYAKAARGLTGRCRIVLIDNMSIYGAQFLAGIGATLALELIVFSLAVWFVSIAVK